jgi:hypothetical protein
MSTTRGGIKERCAVKPEPAFIPVTESETMTQFIRQLAAWYRIIFTRLFTFCLSPVTPGQFQQILLGFAPKLATPEEITTI